MQSLCSLKKLSLFFANARIQPASGDVDSSAHAAADVHHTSKQGSNEHTSKEALKTVKNPCALYNLCYCKRATRTKARCSLLSNIDQ